MSTQDQNNRDTTVAEVVGKWLSLRLGIERIFTVPGEAMLPLLDGAAAEGIQPIAMRHEAGAAFAALTESQLLGRPGVVAVNRAPGAANATIGIDATRCDPTGLLVIVGAVPRGQDPETGYQSRDPREQLRSLARVVELYDPADVESVLQRAEQSLLAQPGEATALVVPQDVWGLVYDGSDPSSWLAIPQQHRPGLSASDLEQVAVRLNQANAPVLVVGQLLRRAPEDDPSEPLTQLGQIAGVPVLAGNKRLDVLSNKSPVYGGDIHQGTHPSTRDRLGKADLAIFVGDLAWEVHTAHWWSDQDIITIHPRPQGRGKLITADPRAVIDQLCEADWPPPTHGRKQWLEGWRALETQLSSGVSRELPDGIDFTAVAVALEEHLDNDAIVCLDAGNFGSWIHRYISFGGGRRLLAIADGSMGSGVPAAVAASLCHPDRQVVAIVGDGGLYMTGNELAVPLPAGSRPVVIVADNQGYGAIRSQGARVFPGVDVAAELVTPDVVIWARAFGYEAARIERQADVSLAVCEALSHRDGYVLHVPISRTAVHANFDLAGPSGPRPPTSGTRSNHG